MTKKNYLCGFGCILVRVIYIYIYICCIYNSCSTNFSMIFSKKKSNIPNLNISKFQQEFLNMLSPLICFKIISHFELGSILYNYFLVFYLFIGWPS